jgi:hypothetical protein
MLRYVTLAVIAAAFVAGIVVPFIIGLVRGPQPGRAQPGRNGLDESMRPLSRIAGIYGRFLLLYLVGFALYASDGFYGGPGPAGSICVDSGRTYFGTMQGVTALPGAVLRPGGDISACALHPSLGQWSLYLLTRLPRIALWILVLLLIWRLITEAGRNGPFTTRAASIVHQLGWVVIAGSMVAAALSELGADVLTGMLMTPATFDVKGTVAAVLLGAPIKALFPVPALAGAALLTFGRMTRAAAVMDEELKGTV